MTKKKTAQGHVKPRRQAHWLTEPPGWLPPLLIIIVGVLAYSNTFQSSFHFDDETSIINNPAIRDLGNLKAIFGYSASRFLTYLTFAANYRLGGLDVVGYHVFNLAVHLSASLMVLLFVRQLSLTPYLKGTEFSESRSFVSIFSALLFAAHPVQCQGVTYIAQRSASLAALFYLVSIYLYGSARLAQLSGRSRWIIIRKFASAFLVSISGVFTKETVLTLPVAVLLYELFFFQEIRKVRWVYVVVVAGVFIAVPTVLVMKGLVELRVEGALPAWQYLVTQPRVWMIYLRLFFFPVQQNLDYDIAPSNSLLEVSALGSLILIGFFVFAAVRLFSNHRILSFGMFWFLLALLPESSILPLPDVIYEHRMYLPMVGISLSSASLIHGLTKRWDRVHLAIVAMLAIGLLAWLSFERNKVWKDDVTLWNDVISKSPNKARAYNNRGKAYLALKRYDIALADFNRAISLNPYFGDAYSNRGNVFLLKGENDKAVTEYQRALKVGVNYASNYERLLYNLGLAYSSKGEETKAVDYYTQAIQANSGESTFYYNRAISYDKLNQLASSKADYDRAIALNPAYAKAYNNRGVVFEKMGMVDSALANFKKSQVLDPTFLPALINSARIHIARSELDRALGELSSALSIEPGNLDIRTTRGKTFLKAREFEKALEDFNAVVQADSWRSEVYFYRGEVLKSMGRTKEADEDFRRADALGFKAQK